MFSPHELAPPVGGRVLSSEGDRPEVWFWAGWEPRRHYRRRGGSRGTYYFGDGPWVGEWEDRLFSDETIEQASDMGATVLITQFYKGFGREVESGLWPRLRDFTERCNRRGMKVWGYLQGSSLYPEFMAAEQPEMHDWIARDYRGRPQIWGQAYYRLRPCLTSAGYRDYMISVIRDGVGQVGLDGIHVDNSYYHHCWCERCQEKFREYLTARGDLELTTGIPDARHIKAPPLPRASDHVQEPLRIHWIEFGVQVRRDFYRGLRAAMKDEKPDAMLSSNAAFPRVDMACELRLGLNPAGEGEVFDFCCAENGNQTRVEKGAFLGHSDSCLLAEAGGYRVWITSWRHGAFGNSPPPDPAGIWALAAEEFSHGAAILGNNWALRAGGEGRQFLFERTPDKTAAFAGVVDFFKALLRAEESLGERRSWTDVVVLVDCHSLSIASPADGPALRQIMQYFLGRKIPFQFVFPGREIPAGANTVVVWSGSCLAQQTLEDLARFASRPGRQVLVADTAGVFDEWHVPYDFGVLRSWRQQPGIHVLRAAGTVPTAGNGVAGSFFQSAAASLSEENRSVLDDFFLRQDTFPARLRFSLPETVLVHTEQARHGELLVHLREQSGSGQVVRGAKVWLAEDLALSREARFHSPARLGCAVSSSAAGPGREFVLPEFSRYGLLVVPPEGS